MMVMATTPSVSLWEDIAARGVQAVVAELSDGDAIALNEQFGTHNYKPLPVNAIRAEGARVWDHEGREFIDAIGAYSAVSHGHLHPAVVNAAKRQLDQVAVVSRAFYSAEVGLFLQGLCDFTGLDRACPMNSGAEAIETCLKLARKWGYTVKGVPLGQAEIIVFDNNFHGRTITVVGFSTEAAYNQHFGPYTPGFKVVPFGDAEALRAAITPNTIAVLGEPIQAEGGILIPPDGYLTAVREICTENNVLLIWDEIQTGFYRTGTRFAWQYEPAARPDLMAVGKPLGGGLLPVSAAVGQNHVMEVFVPGDHGSTFGGNPLGAAVALQAMAEMELADFGRRSRELGAHAIKRLRAEIPNPPMVDLRGRGLLIGVEFGAEFDTKRLSAVLTANGLLTKETRKRTFRLTPALSIDEATLDELINRFVRSVHQVAEGA
jgi:ornithine--oxo-acid transaminase